MTVNSREYDTDELRELAGAEPVEERLSAKLDATHRGRHRPDLAAARGVQRIVRRLADSL